MAHSVTGASIDGILTKLNETDGYHPLDAQTFADWSMQAGDIVNVSRGDQTYSSPVNNVRMVWKGTPQTTISSTGNRERESVSKMSRKKYGRGGAAVRSQEHIYREFTSEDGYLHSYVEMTESYLRTEFSDEMYSLRGEFEVTASHLRTEFEDDINSLRGEFEVTASHMRTEFEDEINSLHGELVVTAASLRADFDDEVNSLHGELVVTAASLRADFDDEINSLHGELVVTAASLRADFTDEVNSLHGELVVTAASLRADFDDEINSLHGELVVTAASLRADFDDEVNSLHGELVVTAASLRADFDDEVNSLHGELVVTAGSLRADFTDEVNSLHGELVTTASELRSEYTDEINSVSSRITQQANKIALVVDGDGNIKAAEIAASINAQTGASTVKLSADIIDIDGDTITEWLESEDVVCDSLDTGALTVGGAVSFDINAPIIGDGGGTSSYNCGDMIVDAEVDSQTNTLTLTRLDGSTVTFSKAASITGLTGSWSGSTLTVVTNPSTGYEYTVGFGSQTANQKLAVDIDRTNPPEIITGTTNLRVPLHVYTPGTGQYDPAIDRYTTTAALSMSSLLEDMTGTNKITANGTYSPSSGYIGFSAVEVKVPSQTITPVLTGGWNGKTFTVSSTPQSTGDKGTTLSSKYSYDSTANVHYIDIDAQDTGAQQPTTRARYELALSTGSVSSGSRTITVKYKGSNTSLSYSCPDYGNGQNSVTLNDASWQYDGDNVDANNRTTNTVTVSTSGRATQLSKTATVYLDTSAAWSNNTKTIYVRRNNGSGEFVAKGSVSAPSITTSNWSLGTFTSPYSYKPSVNINGTTYTSGSNLNATGAYDAGWTAGQTGASASSGARIELYRSPTGNIAYGTTYTIKAKGYSTRSATAKTDISGATLTIAVPSLTVSGWSLGTYSSPYSYTPSVTINGTTYTSSSSLAATSAYDTGWSMGQSVSTGGKIELYRTPTGDIAYGTTYTIKAKAFASRSATAKTDISGATLTIKTPSFPSVTDWALVDYASPYTYKLSVKVGGTTYKSSQINATEAYNAGWTGCYNGVGLDSTTTTTLNYDQQITVYAQAYQSNSATSKTNKASRIIKAPSGNISVTRSAWAVGSESASGYMTYSPNGGTGSGKTVRVYCGWKSSSTAGKAFVTARFTDDNWSTTNEVAYYPIHLTRIDNTVYVRWNSTSGDVMLSRDVTPNVSVTRSAWAKGSESASGYITYSPNEGSGSGKTVRVYCGWKSSSTANSAYVTARFTDDNWSTTNEIAYYPVYLHEASNTIYLRWNSINGDIMVSKSLTSTYNNGYNASRSFVLMGPNDSSGKATFYGSSTTISAGSSVSVWPAFLKNTASSGSTNPSDYIYNQKFTFTAQSSSNYNLNSVTANNDWPQSEPMDSFFGPNAFTGTQYITFPASATQRRRYIRFKIGTRSYLIYQ